jgi:hypothetical protein
MPIRTTLSCRIFNSAALVFGLRLFVFAATLFGFHQPCSAQVLASNDQEGSSPLFSCETDRKGKFIQIRAVEEEAGKRWSAIQYSFGSDGKPEMAYPKDPSTGSVSLFFSHEYRRGQYYVSIRFSTGGFTYRVYSYEGKDGAGVDVSNARGKTISSVACIERPYMVPDYLRMALACDIKNPHGKAACGENPFGSKR